jgi:hypothetical protein
MGQFLKLFKASISIISVTERPFQLILLLLGRARILSYRGVPERCVALGQATALPANIRVGWKGLPETSTQAYYEYLQIMAIRGFKLNCLN